jgi:amino acid transporter
VNTRSIESTQAQPANPTELKKNSLGFIGIAFFVIAAAAPMGVFVGVAPVIFSMAGPQVPIIYILVAATVGLFSVGYLRMSGYIKNGGGFVSYIARGLGRRPAGAAAGLVIVCYTAFLIGILTQFGVFADQLLSVVGIHLPSWSYVIVLLILLAVFSARGIDVNVRVLAGLLVFEILVIAVFIVGIFVHGPGEPGDASLASFDVTVLFKPGLGVALIFAFSSFAGFEATAVFAEEAKEPRKTIPRALFLLVGFLAVFYAIATWAVSYGIGADKVQSESEKKISSVIFDLAVSTNGNWLSILLQIMVLISFIAMLLGFANLYMRYLFTRGRAGYLPHGMSRVSPKTQAPSTAAYVMAGVVAVITIGAHWAGLDPMTVIYSWSIALGSLTFVVLMFLAAIAIIAFFVRKKREKGVVATLVLPSVSVVLTGIILVLTVANYDALLGSTEGGARLTLLAIPIAMILGWWRASAKPTIDFEIEAID